MKERIKWIVAGFGFIVGIQVLTTLMFRLLLAQSAGAIENNQWIVVVFGLTLGAFLFGGFVIGRVEERLRMFDAVAAAVAALVFSAIVYYVLPGGGGKFTGSIWLVDATGREAPVWLSTLQMMPALVASALGAYIGYLMTTQVESWLERFVGFLGIIGAGGGIFVIYIISSLVLPWFLTAILTAAILAGIALSYWLFMRGRHEMNKMTIAPEHRIEPHP